MTAPAGRSARQIDWSVRLGSIDRPRKECGEVGIAAEPVENAIEYMWERFREPLTLQDIAASAQLSRFYFTRVFKEQTQLTPGKFLSAIRLYEAQRMIKSSSLSITDVSLAVGYNSLGSFTSSFTASAGISPGRLRRLHRNGQLVPAFVPPTAPRSGYGSLAGTISAPEGVGNARVYIGAFPTPLVQHPCPASTVIDVPSGRPCCYSLPDVPGGTWYLLAVGRAEALGARASGGDRAPLVGAPSKVSITEGAVVSAALRLRHRRPVDPPPLLLLPDLEPTRGGSTTPGCVSIGAAYRALP
jgi:AraC family transcriptional regulator